MKAHEYDVVVVGAGSAGACAAYHLAGSGLSVALLDRRDLSAAGARWPNGIPPWMFDRAGLDRPESPELVDVDFPVHMMGHKGTGRLSMPRCPFWKVDMALLVGRLQKMARG